MKTTMRLMTLISILFSMPTLLLAVTFSDLTVSNLTSSSATVSFFTDSSAATSVNYGTDSGSLTATSPDTAARLHVFELSSLASDTTYYFTITSGTTTDNNSGSFYTFQTAQVAIGTPYIVYGTVDDGSSAVSGAYIKLIVQQNGTTSSPLSAITDSDGKWNLNLGNLKMTDTGGVMNYSIGDLIKLSILQDTSTTFTQDSSVSGSSPQALDVTVGTSSYSLPADVTVNNLFLKVNSLASTSFDAPAVQNALSGATSFETFVKALFSTDPATDLQLTQVKVAISWVKDDSGPYHLPFAVEASDLATELEVSLSDVEAALSGASTLTDFATTLFGGTPTSNETTQLNQAIEDATIVDFSVAAKLLSFDSSFTTLSQKTTLLQKALDVHTKSSGNTDYDKVAQDLEGITRSQLKEKLAISQAESTFTLSLVKGLNMIALPNRPDVDLTAYSLAEQISDIDTDVSVNFVIRVDPASQKFKAFVPSIDASGSAYNFSIDGGRGYIINLADADAANNPTRSAEFIGRIWVDGITAPVATSDITWAFVIDSPTPSQLGSRQPTAYRLIDQQTQQIRWHGLIETRNRLRIALVDQNRQSVVNQGDQLQLEIFDQQRQLMAFSTVNITARDTEAGLVQVDLRLNPIPSATRLLPNYPNPFNPETWIPFQLHQSSLVSIQIYDASGLQIRRLELGLLPAGLYHTTDRAVYWNGLNRVGEQVASGIYFYQLEVDGYRQTRKMVILK
ncbi:MAG: T9SS type A sorting domain-containing protein [Candidatus Poribacteria bacterium]|nr:T9SS type A sorting domain-containing protein [Candidatus Poribacteria bacterium]